MLFFMAIVLFLIGALALFVHALRSDKESRHGWIVVVPLLIIVGWVLTELLV